MTTTTTQATYRTTYHRDHTVTVWDVYTQQWLRTGSPSDRLLASLSEAERARVIRHCRLDAGRAQTYTATIDMGEGGTTTLTAASVADAMVQAVAWAQAGDWREDGTVLVRVYDAAGTLVAEQPVAVQATAESRRVLGLEEDCDEPTLDALLAMLPQDAMVQTGPRLGDPMEMTVTELREQVRFADLDSDSCPGWRIVGGRLLDEDGAVVVEPVE